MKNNGEMFEKLNLKVSNIPDMSLPKSAAHFSVER